jgi:hypothetical protein
MATKKIDVEIDIRTNVDPVKAKLLELRRELQNTAEGSADFTNITNQIQELERSLGITEEQAKDLGDALEAAPNRIDVKGAGQRLRELQKELRNTQVGTARFNELSAEIRDTQDSLKAAKIGAEDFAGALEAAPGPIGVIARGIKQLELATKSWAGALRLTLVGVLVGITAGLADAFSRNEEVQEKFTGTFDQIRKSFDELLVALLPVVDVINEILKAISPVIRALTPFVKILITAVMLLNDFVENLMKFLRTGILGLFSQNFRNEFIELNKDMRKWSFFTNFQENVRGISDSFRKLGNDVSNTTKEVKELREELQTPLTPFKVKREELFGQLFKDINDVRKKYAGDLEQINLEIFNVQKEIKNAQRFRPFVDIFFEEENTKKFDRLNRRLDFFYKKRQDILKARTDEELKLLIEYNENVDKLNAEALHELNRQLLQFSGSRKSALQLAELDLKKAFTDLKAFIEEAAKEGLLSRREADAKLRQLELDFAAGRKKIRDDARDADLEAVRNTFAEEKTQIENINDAYHEAQKTLDKLRADNLISIDEYNANRLALEERYQAALKKLRDREEQQQQDAINNRLDAIRNTLAAEKTELEQLGETYKKASDDLDKLKAEDLISEEEYNTQRLDLDKRYADAKNEILDRANAERRERNTELFIAEKDELLAYIEFTKSVQLGLNDWSENLKDKAADAEGKRRDRLRKTYKTVALAELAIGSAGAIADIWTKYAQEKAAIALTSVANPALAIIRSRVALVRAIAGTTLVGVQTGIAQQKIRSERLGGGSTAGVGGGGTDSSPLFAGAQRGIPSIAAPQINTGTGINPTQQLADTLSGITNKPIRAYVVSSDISSQQALDRRINRAGTFS